MVSKRPYHRQSKEDLSESSLLLLAIVHFSSTSKLDFRKCLFHFFNLSVIFTSETCEKSLHVSFFLKHIASKSNVTLSWPYHLISVGLSAAENVLPEPKGRAAVNQANYNHFGKNDSRSRINFHFIYPNVSSLLISCPLTAANQSKKKKKVSF